MPTYEYRCKSCGEHLEVVQSFTDDPLTECPACRGQLRKVFGSIGIAFKGSGFYKTDSRPATKAASGNGSSEGKSETKSASTSDAKSSSSESSSSAKPSSGGSDSSGASEAKSA
jgi:putative FmdB family regulatory protein